MECWHISRLQNIMSPIQADNKNQNIRKMESFQFGYAENLHGAH